MTAFYFISGLLHQVEKFFQTGRPLCQCGINGKAKPVLIGKRPFPFFLPFPVMLIFSLAPRLRILHNGQAVFKAQSVREPPQGETGAPKVSEFPGAVKGGEILVFLAFFTSLPFRIWKRTGLACPLSRKMVSVCFSMK